MRFKKALEKLKELLRKWGLKTNDWLLSAHYAHRLEGYKVKLRKGHFNIYVNKNRIPWRIKAPLRKNGWGPQIFPPLNSKWQKEYLLWTKKTGFETDIIPVFLEDIKFFLKNKENFFVYTPRNDNKINVVTVLGLSRRYHNALPEPRNVEKELGLKKMIYLLDIVKEWKKIALSRKDKKVIKSSSTLFKKYGYFLKKLEKIKKINFKKVKAIKGIAAYPGKIKGAVRKILNIKDCHKLKKGEILVAPKISTNFFLSSDKIKGIITDEGGILYHAAIIAREYKIPSIIGTQIATRVLKTGDLVELDAKIGIVKILEKAP